jgi:uncharacterized protein
MFKRLQIEPLEKWSKNIDRKPLVLRGARQVGKTSLVLEFSKQFTQFIHLNLEQIEHLQLFENNLTFDEIVDSIFYFAKKIKNLEISLLFIDEIQNSSNAIKLLRYFYEKTPELRVIAAGSLLETTINKDISFPVGRVEFLYIHPVSFVEYLGAIGEDRNIELIQNNSVPTYAHETLLKHFNRYALIGGMPEIVQRYANSKDITQLQKTYQSLWVSYMDDVEKYAPSQAGMHQLRHILKIGFNYAGQRIKFEQFGESNYRSREMGEAFRLLEKTMLVELVYPITNAELPMIPNLRKSPKLQWFDVGLVNYMAKIQSEIFSATDIADVRRGLTAEIVVAQEILAYTNDVLERRYFWVRDEKNASAEVDFVIQDQNIIIPIEVKSGTTGKLKSLHLFMEQAPHSIAVRIWSKPFGTEQVKTPNGKEFKLLNIPFYLVSQLEEIIAKNL